MEKALTEKDQAYLDSFGLIFDEFRVCRDWDGDLWYTLFLNGEITEHDMVKGDCFGDLEEYKIYPYKRKAE